MKRLLTLVMCAALWLTTPTLVLVETGCGTTPAQITYTSLSATATTVDAMLKAYSERVVAGKVPQATQIRVVQAKSNYMMAFKLAVESVNGDTSVPTPVAVQERANQLAVLLQALLK